MPSILAAEYGEKNRLATHGNLNNDIGVPLMLWQLSKQHRAAVFELGMNHPGEIAYLAQLVQPTVALVNNAQREHQEFMQSVEATAYENGETLAALSDNGVAVFPADDACASIWRQLAGTRRVIDFALKAYAVVTATFQADTINARGRTDLNGDSLRSDRRATGCRLASTTFAMHWLQRRVRLPPMSAPRRLPPD